jgi:hypothetical protein
MTMTPAVRKLVLTIHVTLSVGWFGAIATFLLLSIAGLFSQDAETVRGVYLAMDLIGLLIIIPLSFAALATGLVQALGSPWGLLRHYWVVTKFLLTVLATALLLLHQYSAVAMAAKRVLAAAAGTLPSAGRFGTQLVVDASLALLALLTATTLAVYKPRGLTNYGRRKLRERSKSSRWVECDATDGAPSLGLKILLAVLGAIVAAFMVVHLAGLTGHDHRHDADTSAALCGAARPCGADAASAWAA